jgi:G3E family GTPase
MSIKLNQTKIPVTVLTGFLGSGKTTLLNYILSAQHGKRIAVIENEYGQIGIDHEIVINADEEIFEMNNGCICCTVRGDLIRILGQLAKKRDRFDYVLIETTGMADPAPVAQTFFADEQIKEQFELDSIVTLVDALHGLDQLERSPECPRQIAFADVVLLNKVDLATSDQISKLEEQIHLINPGVEIKKTVKSQAALDSLLSRHSFDLEKTLTQHPNFLTSHHHHHSQVGSVGLTLEGEVNPDKFQQWIGNLLQTQGPDIFRLKGIIALPNEKQKYVFQGVHMQTEGRLIGEWKGPKKTQMVLIGRNLNESELKIGFEQCRI